MAKKTTSKNKEGRPTLFQEEYCEQVEKLCKLGATDAEIAEFFGVCEATVNNWKSNYPKFLESIRLGKKVADMKVANALFDGALDRVVIEKQAIKVKTGQYKEKVEIIEVEKIIPGDFRNQQFWLKNRKSDVWRDKQEMDHSGNIGITWQETKTYPDEAKP